MGLFLYGAAAGLTWVNLSALSGASGAPDYDPNAQVSSISSDSTGSTVAVKNSVSVDGWLEGVSWDLGTLAAIFGSDWATDGTKSILVRGTVVTNGPDSKKYWQSIAVSDSAPGMASVGVGYSIRRDAATNAAGRVGNTADAAIAGESNVVYGFLGCPTGGVANGYFVAAMGGTATSSGSAATDFSSGRIVLSAGCESSANDGPHSGKVLWEAAVIDWSS